MNDEIFTTMHRALDNEVFPAAQLLSTKGSNILMNEAFGEAQIDTIFDIASLTKAICTTTLAMFVTENDPLFLDDPISKFLGQRLTPDKSNITIRHLLNHSSGLPAHEDYYQTVPKADLCKQSGKDIVVNAVCTEPLEYKTGAKSIYSDLGFILLGEIIEGMFDQPLDDAFAKHIAAPLDLNDTFFVDLKSSVIPAACSGNPARSPLTTAGMTQTSRTFAPTEDCPWRDKVMLGEVHDQNAWAMGGVCGHAGLFSTTSDINKFISVLVDSYNGRGNFLKKDTIERFLPFQFKLTESNSTWLLGWDRPSHVNSQAGSHFSGRSIGHLGYTGCSMWIDLENDFWTVLLSNRIHPTTMNEKIKSFRPMIYNLVFEELIAKNSIEQING